MYLLIIFAGLFLVVLCILGLAMCAAAGRADQIMRERAEKQRALRMRRCACGCGAVLSPDRTSRFRRGCAKRMAKGGQP
jgi:hypothetical protein